jgi:hypothetical protein
MKSFTVRATYTVTLHADSEERAIQAANQLATPNDWDSSEWEAEEEEIEVPLLPPPGSC